MDTFPDLFTSLRPRVLGVAYRMLGSMAEAEDVAQEVWLRWNGTDRAAIENAEAWLVATATRIAIDELRMARRSREHYVGIWLPSRYPPNIRTRPNACMRPRVIFRLHS